MEISLYFCKISIYLSLLFTCSSPNANKFVFLYLYATRIFCKTFPSSASFFSQSASEIFSVTKPSSLLGHAFCLYIRNSSKSSFYSCFVCCCADEEPVLPFPVIYELQFLFELHSIGIFLSRFFAISTTSATTALAVGSFPAPLP